MKKYNNKILAYILTLCIILSILTVPVFAQETSTSSFFTKSQENFSKYIPENINGFAISLYKDITNYAQEYKTSFNLENNDFYHIRLGEPFYIINLKSNAQSTIYYYPLLNLKNEFILMMTIIDTNHALQCCLDNELIDELNNIGYFYNDYIFYKHSNTILAQNTDNICYSIDPVLKCVEPENTSYNKLHEKLIYSLCAMEKVNIDENIAEFENGPTPEKYAPSFSIEIDDPEYKEKMLSLNNAKGQGNFGRCWAASVATIANYINGTNITAAQICDEMEIGYDDGGTIIDKQTALGNHGITYNNIRYRSLDWAEITLNINDKKPVAISASSSSNSWHAVTLVGYRNVRVNQFIAIWDSAANSNTGATRIIYYSGSYTTFQSSTSGPTYTWLYSLSAH